jgi:hypothetical protein
VPWEYMKNKVCVGALYPRSVTVKEHVQFVDYILQ